MPFAKTAQGYSTNGDEKNRNVFMKLNSIWKPKQPRIHNELNFNIDDPSLYNCSIFRYMRSHLRLIVEVIHQHSVDYEPAFYLEFESVRYFQCPTVWTGVDFELGNLDERKLLLQKGIVKIDDEMIDAFAQQHALFIIQKPTFNIQIFAGNCAILKNISLL